MARLPRVFHAEGFYHVMSRGNKKAEIFHDTSDYEMFMRLLLRCKQEHHVSIFHYVLMPNHIHLMVRPNGDGAGSKFMQKLKSIFALYYAAKYGTVGHVWQGRFKNEYIDSDAYLLTCGNYIEMNPVRWGLVDNPGKWPYSSFHYYAKGADDKIVEMNPFYENFGHTERGRRTAYARQVSKTRSF